MFCVLMFQHKGLKFKIISNVYLNANLTQPNPTQARKTNQPILVLKLKTPQTKNKKNRTMQKGSRFEARFDIGQRDPTFILLYIQ